MTPATSLHTVHDTESLSFPTDDNRIFTKSRTVFCSIQRKQLTDSVQIIAGSVRTLGRFRAEQQILRGIHRVSTQSSVV